MSLMPLVRQKTEAELRITDVSQMEPQRCPCSIHLLFTMLLLSFTEFH
jgi:hypothetical protein